MVVDKQISLQHNSPASFSFFNNGNVVPMRSSCFLTMGTAFPLEMTTGWNL